jgi:8-oxo-dGTP pyrophosphatase MutT (NUDIX family)
MQVIVHNNYDGSATTHAGTPAQIEASLLQAHPWLQSPDPADHGDIHALLEHLGSGSAYDVEHDDAVPSAVVMVVTDANGRVLFGRRADNGLYTLPAGGVNPGEDPSAAAPRELKEETNLDVVSITPLHVIALPNAVIHCYSVLSSGTLHARNDPDREVADEDWKWVDVRDGVPGNIWRHLAGPPGPENLVRQLFDLKVSKREWNWEGGFADLRKADTGGITSPASTTPPRSAPTSTAATTIPSWRSRSVTSTLGRRPETASTTATFWLPSTAPPATSWRSPRVPRTASMVRLSTLG